MAKPGEKKRDRALYARLVESYQADRIGIFVDFDRLNHPRSPVWDPWENIGPLLLILLAALAIMFFVHLMLGTAVMVFGVLFYLFIVRPWVAQRLCRRALAAAPKWTPTPDITARPAVCRRSCGSRCGRQPRRTGRA